MEYKNIQDFVKQCSRKNSWLCNFTHRFYILLFSLNFDTQMQGDANIFFYLTMSSIWDTEMYL